MSDTAAERLERILHILPAAHRTGGVRLEELAQALEVDVDVVLSDIETVTAREYYHPAGSVDGICVRLEGDRVLLEGAEFDRPARLSPREALALHLGLHALAAGCSDGRRAHVLRFAARLVDALVVPAVEAAPARREPAPELEYEPDTERALLLGLGDDVLRGVLSDAIEQRRSVELLYLKAGADAPAPRRVAPQQLAYAEGRWYLLTRELEHGEPRIFRLDRTLDARAKEPAPAALVEDRAWIEQLAANGRPYIADADEEVVVRYAPAIARWVAEHTGATPEADGSVLVRHQVADPRWIIRHVLGFAGAARIEQPATLREQVARRALELSA